MKWAKKKSKWIIGAGVLIIAVVLIAVLSGLPGPAGGSGNLELLKEGSSKAVNKDEERKETLAIYADDVSGSFNPGYTQGYGDEAVSRIIFEPLMERDKDGKYQPCLASSMKISDDGLTYTIQLQKNVLFSDGSEMTAQDVMASIAAMALSQNGGAAAAAYNNIVGLEKFAEDPTQLPSGLTEEGGYTVKVQFETASPDNLLIMGTQVQKLDLAQLAGGAQTELSIGTGAYQLTDTSTGSRVSLTANEYYRKKIKDIQKVEFRSVSYYDAPEAVENSELDVLLYSDSSLLYDTFYNWDGFSVYADLDNTVYSLFYNQNNSALQNQKVRQAISCSFARGRITKLHGGIAPDMRGSQVSTAYSYDLSKAKKLMEEAGEEISIPDSGLSLRLPIVKDNAVQTEIAQVLRDSLENLGIQLEVTELDQEEYIRALYLTMDFDLYLSGVSVTDSITSYKSFYQQGSQPVSVEDSGISAAYEKLAGSITQDEISENGKALYEAIDEAQPVLMLGRSRKYISVSADLSGYGIPSYEAFMGQIYKIKVK
jgi:peptide/nickel transport system substrate-binding protein